MSYSIILRIFGMNQAFRSNLYLKSRTLVTPQFECNMFEIKAKTADLNARCEDASIRNDQL